MHNLPSYYDNARMQLDLDIDFKGAYDFLSVPTNPGDGYSNKGYCFVNFHSPRIIARFVRKFTGRFSKSSGKDKGMWVSYAKFQHNSGAPKGVRLNDYHKHITPINSNQSQSTSSTAHQGAQNLSVYG